MQLRNVLDGDHALLHMERYVGEGTKSYSPLSSRNEADPEFQPKGDTESFDLVTLRTPASRIAVFTAGHDRCLERFYQRGSEVLFAVHPEIWGDDSVDRMDELQSLARGERIEVCPTASTRTVFASGLQDVVPKHFLKLHFPRYISRFDRRLRRLNIANSIAVTRDLAGFQFDKFAYLPDTLGFVLGNGHGCWGFIVREARPVPIAESRFLIPSFALYGGDLKHPDDLPLLIQLIQHSRADPETFVTEEIIIPVIECWTRVARQRGILLESHGQNTLLEIDREFKPKRIVHRDFDVWVDQEARRKVGLPQVFESGMDESAETMEHHYSLIYDHFLGVEFFDYVLACLGKFYKIDETAVQERARNAFHRSFPDSGDYFPTDTTFYFSDEPSSGNEPALVDTKEAPKWR